MMSKKKIRLKEKYSLKLGAHESDNSTSNFYLQSSEEKNNENCINTNNNGKHKRYHRLSSDGERKDNDKNMKKKKQKGITALLPSTSSMETAKRESVGSLENSHARRYSASELPMTINDYNENVMLPAEYMPPSTVDGRRRSSAHRVSYRKAIHRAGYNMNELITPSTEISSPDLKRKIRHSLTEVDWTEAALPDDHIWAPTSASGDLCYVGEQTCQKSGPRKKCSACHIVVHENCYAQLIKIGFRCKLTFRESTTRSMRETLVVHHHWVHRRKQDGKCKQCGKSFEKRFGFRQPTKIIAISCSWCKEAYHNKVSCFQMHKINEPCTLGTLSKSIVPSTWIIKPSQRQKSIRNRSKKKKNSSSMLRRKSAKEAKTRTFIVRPLSQQAAFVTPTLVFINPKSGGNQGAKLLQSFQWFLNPRQVCDITKGGMQEALELYRKVPNLRILACGGDGTVGWILSTLDKLSLPRPPPVAILPLGTGNDLSRTLNFGPGYTDEPVQKILQGVEDARLVKLDRWKVYVEKNEDAVSCGRPTDEEEIALSSEFQNCAGVDKPPQDVVNNYFSIGSDAQVNLDFHESREAHPGKFNSRIGNKMFYARAGVFEYLTRQLKDLSKHITIICDGKNITPKIRELKPVCVLFLNISRFSAGTTPWGNPTGNEFHLQRHNDKLIEVLAFSFNQLGMLFVGGHGERLCQCRSARISTTKTFPMQIDGEPCRLNPSNIRLEFFNQANMLYKRKRRDSVISDLQIPQEQMKIRVNMVNSHEFERHTGKKGQLCSNSTPLLVTVVMNHSTLDTVRSCLALIHDVEKVDQRSEKWTFLDASNPDKLYKVDRNHETDLMIYQIVSDDKEVYILDNTDAIAKFPRSKQIERYFRNRVHSDSGLLSSQSSGEFYDTSVSSNHSLGTEGSLNLTDLEEEHDENFSKTLDVVFEQPEVSEQEEVFCGKNGEESGSDVVEEDNLIGNFVSEDIEQSHSTSSSSSSSLKASSLKDLSDHTYKDENVSSTSSGDGTMEKDHLFTDSIRVSRQNSLMSQRLQTTMPAATAISPPFDEPMLLGEFVSKMNLHDEDSTRTVVGKNTKYASVPSGDGMLLGDFVATKSNNGNQSNNVTSKELPEESENWNKVFLDASKRGDLAKLMTSHRNGVDLSVCDEEGCSALHNAARFAHLSIVEYLIEHGSTKMLDLLCRNRKQTALHKAAWYGRIDICKRLIDAGASININDYKGKSAVDRARQAESKSLVEYLTNVHRLQAQSAMKNCHETDL